MSDERAYPSPPLDATREDLARLLRSELETRGYRVALLVLGSGRPALLGVAAGRVVVLLPAATGDRLTEGEYAFVAGLRRTPGVAAEVVFPERVAACCQGLDRARRGDPGHLKLV
jgi:hypothetical protein